MRLSAQQSEKLAQSRRLAQEKIFCKYHKDKQIEYFCQLCNQVVCAKCMFAEHNGHHFCQLHDVTPIITTNIADLEGLISKTKLVNDHSQAFINTQLQKITAMKEEQIDTIERGFTQVIQKLEAKKAALKSEFEIRYNAEIERFVAKLDIVSQKSGEIDNIATVQQELAKFCNKNSDVKILNKVNEVTDFLTKSTQDLQAVHTLSTLDETEFQIPGDFVHVGINVDKIFKVIDRFKMLPSGGDLTYLNSSKSANKLINS